MMAIPSAGVRPLWGRLPTCGPIANRSIRAQPGRLFTLRFKECSRVSMHGQLFLSLAEQASRRVSTRHAAGVRHINYQGILRCTTLVRRTVADPTNPRPEQR
jgi:hypothetical protein